MFRPGPPRDWRGGSYLSGMGLGLRGLEEGVRQLPHPHGHGLGHDGALGVHHGVEKRLQVRFRVAPNVNDLVSDRRVVLARIHCSTSALRTLCGPKTLSYETFQRRFEPSPNFFFFFCQIFNF